MWRRDFGLLRAKWSIFITLPIPKAQASSQKKRQKDFKGQILKDCYKIVFSEYDRALHTYTHSYCACMIKTSTLR